MSAILSILIGLGTKLLTSDFIAFVICELVDALAARSQSQILKDVAKKLDEVLLGKKPADEAK